MAVLGRAALCPGKAVEIGVVVRLLRLLPLLFPLLRPTRTHWPSLQAALAHFPGCCPNPESFDCGNGLCLSVSRFHDGQMDCPDGSDEFCLPGQIPCGQFCADPLHLGECLRNPNCTKQRQNGEEEGAVNLAAPLPPLFCPLLKRRLCGVLNTISCRGYGECIFVKWLMDGKRDCLDGSDEDAEYASLFKVTPLREEMGKGVAPARLWPSSPLPSSTKFFTEPTEQNIIMLTTRARTTMAPFPLWGWTAKMKTSGRMAIPWKNGEGRGRKGTAGEEKQGEEGTTPARASHHGGVRVVMESTEPGPWQNPALDDFGGEFGRLLATQPTTHFATNEPTTTRAGPKLMTGNAVGRKAVVESIIFPNWPSREKEAGGEGKGREQQGKEGSQEATNSAGGGNLSLTTPKYPFDRGKIGEQHGPEEISGKKTIIIGARTTMSNMGGWAMEEGGGRSRGMTSSRPAEVWMPEEGRRDWMGKAKEEGRGEVGKGEGDGMEGRRKGIGTTTTMVGQQGVKEKGEEEQEREEESIKSGGISPVATTLAPPLPTTELFPLSRWSIPVNLSGQSGLNCTERMSSLAGQLPPASTRCQCPVGRMRHQTSGQCLAAPISTFRVRVDSLCGTNSRNDSPLEEQLTLLKAAASLQGQPVCVRHILDGPVIVMNTVCDPPDCTIEDLAKRIKSAAPLPEIKLKIGEISGGACSKFALNDCDEKAECLVDGLRYGCHCLPGTNDTSDGSGRTCEGTVISQSCTKFLGVCFLVWLLMLLLLCFLLPIIAYLCFKHCCETSQTKEAVKRRWRWLKAKIMGKEPTLLPIITTSAAAPSGPAQRRESGIGGISGTDIASRGDTLKVPSIIDSQKPYLPPIRQQTQTDSEEYLILEDDEAGEEVEEEREEAKRDSGEKGGEEWEEGKNAGMDGEGGKGTRQQTEQSTGTQKSEGEDTAGQLPVKIQQEEETVADSMAHPEEPIEQPGGRPASVASRAGTPTIWDQFRILGDQYARLTDIEERRESKNSLEELLDKAKERERATKRPKPAPEGEELAERMKDELDAELKLRGNEEEVGGIEEEEGEKGRGRRRWEGGGENEPGRSIPAPGPGMLPPGALNIGFGFADGIDIPTSSRATVPSSRLPPPSRQFVPKPFGAKRTKASQSDSRASSGGSTLVKVPAKGRGGEKWTKGEFVVVKGRKVEKDDEEEEGMRRRRQGMREEGEEKGTKMRRGRMVDKDELRPKAKRTTIGERRGICGGTPRTLTPAGAFFDPDLPTTSQADPYWQKSLRQRPKSKEHSAEFLRKRFRQEGRALRLIEEQIEQKVHTGCIVGGRKPWDVSPRLDQMNWREDNLRRELSLDSEDGGGMERSLERMESRVHSGCITDRKPWDSGPYNKGAGLEPHIRRGYSEWDLGKGRRMEEKEEEEEVMREAKRGRTGTRQRRRPSSLERSGDAGKRAQNWLDLD